MSPRDEIRIGDLFWDEHRDWCDGSETLNVCYLVLSADEKRDRYLYRCAFFMWAADGYCGAHERKFTAEEVLKMTRVGNIADIKSFYDRAAADREEMRGWMMFRKLMDDELRRRGE